MTDWLYPVNPTNKASWGYTESPIEVMAGKQEDHTWYVPRKFGVAKGDLIWVRESKHKGNPVAQVIGAGVVRSDVPRQRKDGAYYFKVVFGTALCHHLAANPFTLQVEAPPQAPLKLRASEQAQLAQVMFEFAASQARNQALGR
jgi:hypothetical protein